MANEARQGPFGVSPEASRLVGAKLVEVVGASTLDEFAKAISERTMPLLRGHVEYIRNLPKAEYVYGDGKVVDSVEIAVRYLEEMEKRPGGLFFGE